MKTRKIVTVTRRITAAEKTVAKYKIGLKRMHKRIAEAELHWPLYDEERVRSVIDDLPFPPEPTVPRPPIAIREAAAVEVMIREAEEELHEAKCEPLNTAIDAWVQDSHAEEVSRAKQRIDAVAAEIMNTAGAFSRIGDDFQPTPLAMNAAVSKLVIDFSLTHGDKLKVEMAIRERTNRIGVSPLLLHFDKLKTAANNAGVFPATMKSPSPEKVMEARRGPKRMALLEAIGQKTNNPGTAASQGAGEQEELVPEEIEKRQAEKRELLAQLATRPEDD